MMHSDVHKGATASGPEGRVRIFPERRGERVAATARRAPLPSHMRLAAPLPPETVRARRVAVMAALAAVVVYAKAHGL